MSQLITDCLNDIFEYLEDDGATLLSCLLVNRLWCEIAVRILWRNGRKYNATTFITLIACLPNESKKILRNNEINIPTSTSKPPMFNYAAFCKSLSTYVLSYNIKHLLKDQLSILNQDLNNKTHIVEQEIIKLFMNQITSLKSLILRNDSCINTLTIYPRAKECLKNLSELDCNSNHSEFIYQLSQICHNILSLSITFNDDIISNGLMDLISVQKNLKSLQIDTYRNAAKIFPSLIILPN